MKVVVAIDSFKGSLSSLQAGSAVKEAVQSLYADAQVVVKPLADGGEGTVDAFSAGLNCETVELPVTGPLGSVVTAKYCILADKTTAVMEMAAAAGITLISAADRDPMETTTYGVGEMIQDAVSKGCRRFIMGIGGSATNDGGAGMLAALGYDLLDEAGNPIAPGAKGLKDLKAIQADHALPQLKECTFYIACDVNNPLCGETGCSAIYGPQKGATSTTIPLMDGYLANYAAIAKTVSPTADPDFPGAGAAGGLGFAFLAFTNATLRSGIQLILEETQLEKDIINADIVVTGEGRLDSQTAMGKAPIGVAQLAKKHGKKVIAFSGCVTQDAEICNEHGIDAFFPILRQVTSLREALDTRNAYSNLQKTALQVFRLLQIAKK